MPEKPKIKFSHNYSKFPYSIAYEKGGKALLLGVEKWDITKLPAKFLDYDTEYFNSLDSGDSTSFYYQLPEKGEVLVLFFWDNSDCGGLFTTIRRHTPEKEEYYRALVGIELEVVLDG